MPSFRPFAHRALFGSYYANVFWTFIVPKKFRGFDQTTPAYASKSLAIVNQGLSRI